MWSDHIISFLIFGWDRISSLPPGPILSTLPQKLNLAGFLLFSVLISVIAFRNLSVTLGVGVGVDPSPIRCLITTVLYEAWEDIFLNKPNDWHIHGTGKVAAVNGNDHFLIWIDEHKLISPTCSKEAFIGLIIGMKIHDPPLVSIGIRLWYQIVCLNTWSNWLADPLPGDNLIVVPGSFI